MQPASQKLFTRLQLADKLKTFPTCQPVTISIYTTFNFWNHLAMLPVFQKLSALMAAIMLSSLLQVVNLYKLKQQVSNLLEMFPNLSETLPTCLMAT